MDVRESGESGGGHITGAQCSGGDMNASQLRDLAGRWRAGSHIVLYCTRSQSRAPLAASRLLKQVRYHREERVARGVGMLGSWDRVSWSLRRFPSLRLRQASCEN